MRKKRPQEAFLAEEGPRLLDTLMQVGRWGVKHRLRMTFFLSLVIRLVRNKASPVLTQCPLRPFGRSYWLFAALEFSLKQHFFFWKELKMKLKLQRKRGRAEAGTRSSSHCTLMATELGDSRSGLQGRGERRDANVCDCDVPGRGPKNFVLFSRTPSPCGLVRNTLSPAPHPVIPTSGLGGFRSSLKVEKRQHRGSPTAAR